MGRPAHPGSRRPPAACAACAWWPAQRRPAQRRPPCHRARACAATPRGAHGRRAWGHGAGCRRPGPRAARARHGAGPPGRGHGREAGARLALSGGRLWREVLRWADNTGCRKKRGPNSEAGGRANFGRLRGLRFGRTPVPTRGVEWCRNSSGATRAGHSPEDGAPMPWAPV